MSLSRGLSVDTLLWSMYTKEKPCVTVMNGQEADSWPFCFLIWMFLVMCKFTSHRQKFTVSLTTPTHSHHHLPHQHFSQLLHPGPRWAINGGMTCPWNVRMPILHQLPNDCSLYLKSDLMSPLAVSCCLLGTCKGTSQPFWHYSLPGWSSRSRWRGLQPWSQLLQLCVNLLLNGCLRKFSRSWGKVVSVQVWCEVGWAWSCLRNGLRSLSNPSLCRHSIEPRHTYSWADACTHTHTRKCTLPIPSLSKHPLKNKVSF